MLTDALRQTGGPLTKKERAWADASSHSRRTEARLPAREGRVSGITFDAGGLIALDRNDRRVLALIARAAERGMRITVPATALAQAIRKPARQTRLSRLIRQACTDLTALDGPDADGRGPPAGAQRHGGYCGCARGRLRTKGWAGGGDQRRRGSQAISTWIEIGGRLISLARPSLWQSRYCPLGWTLPRRPVPWKQESQVRFGNFRKCLPKPPSERSYSIYVEKDWEARFRIPRSTDWKAIVIALAIITLPFFLPIYIFLLLGLLPAWSVSFIMRKLGRRPLKMIGIAAIALSVWGTLLAWWMVTWGNKPCSPCV